jgi:hypothetical protein
MPRVVSEGVSNFNFLWTNIIFVQHTEVRLWRITHTLSLGASHQEVRVLQALLVRREAIAYDLLSKCNCQEKAGATDSVTHVFIHPL